MNYWEECISEALGEEGIIATEEQIKNIAYCVEIAQENYGMAHGYECIPNPLLIENKKLKEDLKKEREKVVCKECHGKGRIIISGPYHSSDSQCDNCRGEGKVNL